ncbi:MFS-type efflux pump [Drechslerella dactyloides]|uniref:MFS-type efflux pump n=1 Tax=Drechslerella dactyloides TaxID=74499 RepID=A0AAD6IRR9_DREDA|nr:MFS-type efflux pump [Drechslerella dactyloides]
MGLSTSGINDNDVPNWLAKEAEFTPNNNARPESRRPTENAEQLRVKDEESQELSSLSNNITYWNLILDQGVVTERIILHRFLGSGTRDDPYLVEYIPRDPRNPMGFPQWKKWAITMVMAIATLAIAFVSSAYAGGMEQIIQEFHCSMQVSILGISLFVLGFAIGPLFWAPLSEMYGRQKLFFGTFAALTAFNIGAANANSIEALLLMRFFAGAFGSSPLTNAGGVIADMFPASERGLAMAVFAAAPNMGPVMGPIAGGFLGQSAGWRWVEGLLAVFSGLTWLLMAFTVPETYSPVLLRERALRLTNVTGKESKESSDSSPEDGFIPEEKVDISDSNQYNGGNLLEIPSTPYLAHVGTRRSRSPGSAPYPDLENGLQRELTRGSTLTRKSQQVRTSEMGSWENNPFDIERVYSSEAFKSQLQGC